MRRIELGRDIGKKKNDQKFISSRKKIRNLSPDIGRVEMKMTDFRMDLNF
jgi:hypothetical protein